MRRKSSRSSSSWIDTGVGGSDEDIVDGGGLRTAVDGSVASLFAFVPDGQTDKLRVIADIRDRIEKKRGSMSKSALADIDEWSRYLKRVRFPIGHA